jgi:acetyltransferase-like isoleucine patch superfamily enzyme
MKVRDLRRINFKRIGQAFFNAWLTKVPSLFANQLKISLLRSIGATVGSGVKIGDRLRVLGAANLVMGNDVALAHSVVLDARGGLTLHDGVLVGFESVLITFTHASDDPHRPVHHQGTVEGPIAVGSNAWLGARCLVLPGTRVGTSSIVGAMSVVSRDIPDATVAAGIPARAIKARTPA